MKKVLITVGYKQREFNYITLLATYLKNARYEVHVRYSNFEIYQEIFSWQPDFFICGQVNQNENIELARYATASGARVVVLNCEGTYDRNQPIIRFGSRVKTFVDTLIAWGEQHKIDALANTDLSPDNIVVTGTPKFDLYKLPFKNYFTSQQPYQNKIDPKKKTICLATSLAAAETPWQRVAHNVAYQEMGRDFFELRTACQRKLREAFVDLAITLSKVGKYNVIFRVHPLESDQFYRNAFEDTKEIIFDNTVPAVQLFSSIDVLIHRSSTLATEAWIVGIPTATFDPLDNADKDILDFTKNEHVFHKKSKLLEWIYRGTYKKTATEKRRSSFLKTWYGFVRKDKELSSQKIVNVIQGKSQLVKHKKFHRYLPIYTVLNIIKSILGKKHIYEVIAIIKGKMYLRKMRTLDISEVEVVNRVAEYQRYLESAK